MAEYIEREAVMFHIAGVKVHLRGDSDWICGYRDALQAVGEVVQKFPAADVAPVRHGRWEKKAAYHDGIFNTVACSACKTYQPIGCWDYYDYCPNCGCRMDLEGGGGK